MLKSILLGLDGSPHSKVATEVGIAWAKRFDALLVGIAVIDAPGIRQAAYAVPGGQFAQTLRASDEFASARRHAEQCLAQFTLRCAEAQVACKVLEDVGSPPERIALEAERYDVVLLGRRTYFQTATHEGPDDTLFQALRQSPRPVLTVPDSMRPGRCVMAAYDGSVQAAHAIDALQSTGLHAGRPVYVVAIDEDRGQASRKAERAADFLRQHDVQVVTHPVASAAAPASVILECVKELDPGLLAMGAYGQPAWREFILGSVTRAILKDNPVPLMLCR